MGPSFILQLISTMYSIIILGAISYSLYRWARVKLNNQKSMHQESMHQKDFFTILKEKKSDSIVHVIIRFKTKEKAVEVLKSLSTPIILRMDLADALRIISIESTQEHLLEFCKNIADDNIYSFELV